jgi:hypothetical protein
MDEAALKLIKEMNAKVLNLQQGMSDKQLVLNNQI